MHRKAEYVSTTPPVPLGAVEAKDIRSATPDLVRVPEEDARHYRIVWRILVERGGYSFRFDIGSSDGHVVYFEEQGG